MSFWLGGFAILWNEFGKELSIKRGMKEKLENYWQTLKLFT
jgi:predicted RNA-binding protein with PUA domain